MSRSQLDEPYQIRRMLTENTVSAADRRAQFIGLDAYQQAGGAVLRDLFEPLRELDGVPADLTEEERATFDALRIEFDKLEADYQDADELPDEVDQRLGEIEAALSAFEARPAIYDPGDITRAGVFVSIDDEGALSVNRGYVRPEDEAPVVVDVGAESAVGGEPPTGRAPRSRSPARSLPSPVLQSNWKMTRTTPSSRCRTASSLS